jgi:chromosome segregation ATPase
MSPLPSLIVELEAKSTSLTTAISNFVGFVKSIKSAVEQCEAELAAKRRAHDTEVARMGAEIAQTRRDQDAAERELREVRKELEKERKEIGRAKADIRAAIEQFEAGRQ